jgi:homospermidine synthase
MAKHNNATSLQVVSSVVAAMIWTLENPSRGVVESEDLDHELIYDLTEAYWSPIVREYTTWRPSAGSNDLSFAEFQVNP